MIGIFDSGIGGLTYVKEFRKLFPKHDFVYLGDTARVPYGTRSLDMIKKFAEQDLRFLLEKKCELIIVACNTVSADALRYLQQTYTNTKILGVLVPATEAAVHVTKNAVIGVVGTNGTIQSNAYEREIHKLNARIRIHQHACPLLVPLIEEGLLDKSSITRKLIKQYTRQLKDAHVDTVILGCTHYPVLENAFQQIMGKRVTIINSSRAAAEALVPYLDRHPEIASKLTLNSTEEYYLTDVTERFRSIGEKFLGQKLPTVQPAILE